MRVRQCGQEGEASDLDRERLLKLSRKLKGGQLKLTPLTDHKKRLPPL